MAKVDKSQFTKEEWLARKERKRLEKAQKAFSKQSPTQSNNNENYILCLKHGTKYSSEYVNKLYNMVKRHCSLDYEFVCLTDDPKGIDTNIKILQLPGGMSGWWCKPYIFSKDLPIKGVILYLDLDIVISSSIDKLFGFQPDHWCTIRDFTRVMRPKWHKYNSSVVRFKTGELDFVWTKFKKDQVEIQKRLHGDQDWLWEATQTKRAMLYPDSWILSWKWEVRNSKEFAPGGLRGNRKFKTPDHKSIPKPECCVCVFHGDPNPELIEDKWVVDNWN